MPAYVQYHSAFSRRAFGKAEEEADMGSTRITAMIADIGPQTPLPL